MKWSVQETINEKSREELIQYPEVLRQLLYNRGIRTSAEAEKFLSPSYDQLVDPEELYGIEKAVAKIEEAIATKKKIFIHGDFDADGICATALLWEYLYRDRGADVLPYIPSRVDEGYGLSEKSIEEIIKRGGEMIITVDCGIRDVEIIKKMRKSTSNLKGADIIVTDHHQPGEKLPAYVPVVHPMHPKGSYPNPYISGATVAWKLVAAMQKSQDPKRFSWEHVPGIDLAAFATVCDLVPLSDENRVIVKYGIEQMKEGTRVGLQALAESSSVIPSDIEAYHLGYVLGPRINASGRIGDPMDALRLLTTPSRVKAAKLANKLSKLNQERQDITESLFNTVREQIEEESKGKHLYVAYGNDWPEGIIGLVASKLQEFYYRPVVLMTKGENSIKGSARSVPGFNIIEAIEKYKDYLQNFGGHNQAAGFSIDETLVNDFKKELEDHGEKHISKDALQREVSIDTVVEPGDLDWEIVEVLEKMKPFGYGNKRPVFWIKDAVVVEHRTVGDGKHLKMMVKGKHGTQLDCIFFRGGERGDLLEVGSEIEIVGKLEINRWNGKENLQINVSDMNVG